MKSSKKKIAFFLCALILIMSTALIVFATTGRSYTQSFTTRSNVNLPSNLYGYSNLAMHTDRTWARGGAQTFTVRLYVRNFGNFNGLDYVTCNTANSGCTHTWYGANDNEHLAKEAYYEIQKQSNNSVEIGGDIISWSFSNN